MCLELFTPSKSTCTVHLCMSTALHQSEYKHHNSPHHNRFTAIFPRPPGWVGARRELLDFMVQGKINRGRHTDHPDGRHSIRTSNQCPPPPWSPSPIFLQAGCPSCRPTNSVKAPKATSAFGLGRVSCSQWCYLHRLRTVLSPYWHHNSVHSFSWTAFHGTVSSTIVRSCVAV